MRSKIYWSRRELDCAANSPRFINLRQDNITSPEDLTPHIFSVHDFLLNISIWNRKRRYSLYDPSQSVVFTVCGGLVWWSCTTRPRILGGVTEEADTRLGTIKEIIKALKHSFPRFFSSVFKCKEGNTRESSNYPLGLGGGDGVEESLSISPLTNSLEGRGEV